MKIRAKHLGACAIVAIAGLAASSQADVLEFTDKAEWFAAVGPVTTIDFTGFPEGTFITDQFEDVGVLFTDGDDNVGYGCNSAPNDCWGLDGNEAIHLAFLTPQRWIAVDFPGIVQFELYSGGELTYTSPWFGAGVGLFAGLLSTEPFDMARITDPFDSQVGIDDLHFGVPTPGAVWLLGISALYSARRRRTASSAALV
jgi:hypothetical protein